MPNLVKSTDEELLLAKFEEMTKRGETAHHARAIREKTVQGVHNYLSSFIHVAGDLMPWNDQEKVIASLSDEELLALERLLIKRARSIRMMGYCIVAPLLACIPVFGWLGLFDMIFSKNGVAWEGVKFERRRKLLQKLQGDDYFTTVVIPELRKQS